MSTATPTTTEYAARHTAVPFIAPHAHLIVDIPLDLIQPSAENPRSDFNSEELKLLAKSLKEHGQIEPIVVHRVLHYPCKHQYAVTGDEERALWNILFDRQRASSATRQDLSTEKGAFLSPQLATVSAAMLPNQKSTTVNPLSEGSETTGELAGLTCNESGVSARANGPMISGFGQSVPPGNSNTSWLLVCPTCGSNGKQPSGLSSIVDSGPSQGIALPGLPEKTSTSETTGKTRMQQSQHILDVPSPESYTDDDHSNSPRNHRALLKADGRSTKMSTSGRTSTNHEVSSPMPSAAPPAWSADDSLAQDLGCASAAFGIIAGERRLKAAQLAGLPTLAAILREDLDDRGARALRLIENLHRVQLNPVEEAHGFAAMHEALGMTEAEIAKLAGRTQPQIAKRLALLRLPESVQGYIVRGTLTQSHANALVGLAPFPAIQTRLADLAASQAWPVAALEKPDASVWAKLVGEGLAARLGYSTNLPFEDCKKCPFGAVRKGSTSYGTEPFCLNPEHLAALRADLERTRDEERAAKEAAAAALGGETGLPKLDDLRSYERLDHSWKPVPPGCSEACACRSAGIGYTGEVVPICTDPARYRRLEAEHVQDAQAANAAALQRRRDQLAAHMEPLIAASTPRAFAVVVRKLLGKVGPEAARLACSTYGKGLDWPKKDKLPTFDALEALGVGALERIAFAAVIGDEIAQRQQWSSSPMEAIEWFFGPDPGTVATSGPCVRCGVVVELTAEDLADPAGVLCTGCA